MSELTNCPFCGKEVQIYIHPEWDEKIGLVYGALIEHRECTEGMEVSLYSVGYKKTEKEARDTLTSAWNTRKPRFTTELIKSLGFAISALKRNEAAIAECKDILENRPIPTSPYFVGKDFVASAILKILEGEPLIENAPSQSHTAAQDELGAYRFERGGKKHERSDHTQRTN